MIQPVKEKIILGIDPGTNIMGYGVLKVTGVKPQVMALGVIDLRKCTDPYLKLKHIYERVQGVISSYLPDELAIEAPFFGKNVQSMLKLGRAQGVAIVAALCRDIPVTEYAPLKIKMAITGNGQASKEQVAVCCIFPSRKWDPLWMLPMHWGLHIVIICKWAVRLCRKRIQVGKTIYKRIPIK